jgi:uncharacterized membrane protein YeaQ/YmgE (transglycosylase-associated protein family)
MNNKNVLWLLIAAILVGFMASLLASQNPDGLKRVAEILGFSHNEIATPSLFPGYSIITCIVGIILIIFIFKSLSHLKFDIKYIRKLLRLENKEK